jgi:hypothetical protein
LRYYSIQLFNSQGVQYKSYNSQDSFGNPLMSALNVEFDLQVVSYDVATNASYVRVWGIPIEDISQAAQLTGNSVLIWAGFQKGLPLAKPQQAGLIAGGRVVRSFANWIGTAMTLDMIIESDTGTKYNPSNIVIEWQKGQSLAQALKQTLNRAYPGVYLDINISSKLVLGSTVTHCCATLNQLAQFVTAISYDILGNDYNGITISKVLNTIIVWDDTNSNITGNPTVNLDFTDLMGQPTWIDAQIIQITCPMRADIALNSYITLPSTPIITIPGSINATITGGIMQSSVFQGQNLRVIMVRHTGNFRSSDAHAWITVINATLTSQENIFTPLPVLLPLGSVTDIQLPPSLPIVKEIL